MRVEWLPIAARNRDSQIAYIADRNLWAAIDVADAIDASVQRLTDYPNLGRPGRVPGTRELVVTGTPYVIAYRVELTATVIVRLLHGAQRWPERF